MTKSTSPTRFDEVTAVRRLLLPWLTDRVVPQDSIATVGLVLFDFDGPMCSLFHRYKSDAVWDAVLDALNADGSVPRRLLRERNAHTLLRTMWQQGSEHVERANKDLTDQESLAAGSALPTPHARELMELLAAAGIRMAITSNNSAVAIRVYLERNGLTDYFGDRIYARGEDPGLMKPNAHTLTTAVALVRPVGATVLLGDSVSDAEAAWRAGVAFIGCVHPADLGPLRKLQRWRSVWRLRRAGADVVVRDLSAVLAAFAVRTGI